MTTRVLLIGSGGRESALAYKLAASPSVYSVHVFPGNGYTGQGLEKVQNVSEEQKINEGDYQALVQLAQRLQINLVVLGPDVPVVDGAEAFFRAAEIPCFAPSKEAAQLEGSKTFSKDFMDGYGIPTAAYRNFRDHASAEDYVRSIDHRIVIKASGLAAGKGVIIPETQEEALASLREIMLDKRFGDAGDEVVIEEFLEGDEMSILTFCDGKNWFSLPPAQDHKRIFDTDKGPNTGGMGCYSPIKIATPEVLAEVDRLILKPTFDGLRNEGMPFVGLLFTGIMLTAQGPKVIEYNVRFGDPEAQTLIPLLSPDTDLAAVMMACIEGRLPEVSIRVEDKACAVVVVASGGYPGPYEQGKKIELHTEAADPALHFFHAGTKLREDGTLVTAGGRVIAVSATADSLEDAVKLAYEGVGMIEFEGMFYRRDIAHRALPKKET